jgi:asparagine synthase (glutamine-hydrolysing)
MWQSKDGRVCLGSRRLAILDPGPAAHQPFVSSDDRRVITLNGEIYNFREQRKKLEAEGAVFRTGSDTEVLLEAFGRLGLGCLDRLSGMFAFAIWDSQRQSLFCARDRTGEKPFYYAQCDKAFLFASELKSIVAWPAFRKKLHGPALVDFLTFGFVTDPMTIWEGCRKLPPGNWIEVHFGPDGVPEMNGPHAWWDWSFRPDADVHEWGPELRDTLQRAAKEMTVADVPVGIFLSGGVDSSAVTAALSRAGHAVQSFTIGFHERVHDERSYARTVADMCRTSHTEKVVTADDIAPVMDQLVWHYDEPFNDYSYLPTFYLCRTARDHITVALSGDGGDEVFAGYRKYQRLGLRCQIAPWMPPPIKTAFRGVAGMLPWWSDKRRTLMQHGLAPDAMVADMLNLGFPLSLLLQVARGPLAEALRTYRPIDTVRRHLTKTPIEEVGLVNAMRYLDLKLTLAGGILVKVDRASMAVSLEVRPVFLHRDLLELASRVPDQLLADRQHTKEVLKSAMRPWLPEEILYRRKMGFAMPLGKWLANDLENLSRGSDTRGALDDIVDPSLRERVCELHLEGRTNLASCVHSLLFLERWLERWL